MNVSYDSSPHILVCQERVILQRKKEKGENSGLKGSKVYFKGVKIVALAFEVGVKVLGGRHNADGCEGRSALDAK